MKFSEQADRRVEELAFLRALGEVMASDLRADMALARAVDLCFVRFELGAMCAFRATDDGFRLVAAHGVGSRARARLERASTRELGAMFGGPPLTLTDDLSTADHCTALCDEEGALLPRSALFAPLVHVRRRLGALLLVGHEGDRLGAPARATWEPVINTISVALRAADDFERVVALEAEKRQLVDNLPLIVARFDPATSGLLFVNAAVQRVLGVRPSDALNAAGLEAALADDLERETSRAARARAARGVHSPWEDRRYRHSDGRMLTLRECVYPVYDTSRAVHAVETIAYDITTEIEARRGLMQADRLAALGALAAGVAHEINNPIAFISLAAGQLGRLVDQVERGEPGAGDRVREVASDVQESAGRIADIVGELKLFTRIGEGSVVCPVDLNRILETALALTSHELRRHAQLDVAFGALPVAPGSFVNLGHAFVNLLMNAAQAIASKRAAESDADRAPAGDVIRVATLLSGEAIIVRIEDTGIGIEARALPRIFEPFFKTDVAGEGVGLGLAIAYDLVRRVGGDIKVDSQRGRGTTFEVILPVGRFDATSDTPASTRPRPPSVPSLVQAPNEAKPLPRVLIIDDERALTRALARQLSERYDVDTATSARDALAQLNVHEYDAIVCDLRLPDQSGPQIYEAVRARSVDQARRFVFTTGGSYGRPDDELHDHADATGLPVLEKPFDGQAFEDVVASVVARPRRRS